MRRAGATDTVGDDAARTPAAGAAAAIGYLRDMLMAARTHHASAAAKRSRACRSTAGHSFGFGSRGATPEELAARALERVVDRPLSDSQSPCGLAVAVIVGRQHERAVFEVGERPGTHEHFAKLFPT